MTKRAGGRGHESRDIDKVLCLLKEALAILDQTERPKDIGAHIDLAICRLSDLNSK